LKKCFVEKQKAESEEFLYYVLAREKMSNKSSGKRLEKFPRHSRPDEIGVNSSGNPVEGRRGSGFWPSGLGQKARPEG
jgi:hypothetical protein